MLGRLRMSIKQCIDEYIRLGKDVFGKPRWFSVRGVVPLPIPRSAYGSVRLERWIKALVRKAIPDEAEPLFSSPPEKCKT
jgi:hypothetical protein